MRREMNDKPQSGFEDRLRRLRPSPPALDRDRLMYLAGQRAGPRPNRMWPALTIGSWLACAALFGFVVSRPAEVVTRTRFVERVVRVPVERQSTNAASSAEDNGPSTSSESITVEATTREAIWSLEDLEGPLTAGGWHTAGGADRRLAMASPPREGGASHSASPPPPPMTYGELRRALINEEWDGSLDGLF